MGGCLALIQAFKINEPDSFKLLIRENYLFSLFGSARIEHVN
jgi:hypothetical protein